MRQRSRPGWNKKDFIIYIYTESHCSLAIFYISCLVITGAIKEVTEKMNNPELRAKVIDCLIDVMNNKSSLLAAYQQYFVVYSNLLSRFLRHNS